MQKIVLIALLLVCSMAVQMKRPMTNSQIERYESLKKDNKWASIMLNLAELHIAAQGPLDQLVDAINGVVSDLEGKIQRAHDEYAQKTGEHNQEVSRINSQIDNANQDIASTTELLNNVLYVQRDTLTQDIANLQRSIANAKQYIEEQTALRVQQHDAFEVSIQEHADALAAIQEAQQVLAQLQDGSSSLIQIKQAKKSLNKVSEKCAKNIEGSMVKALLALTSGEFANSESLNKVANLLLEIANNLQASVEKTTAEEVENQANFEADVQNKRNEINMMNNQLSDKQRDLENTNQSIEDNEQFLRQRQRDLAQSEADLVQENENFDRTTAIYEDLVAQLGHEHSACVEALEVLNSADIAGYIGGRMEQDVIISQPHGSGINVHQTEMLDRINISFLI